MNSLRFFRRFRGVWGQYASKREKTKYNLMRNPIKILTISAIPLVNSINFLILGFDKIFDRK